MLLSLIFASFHNQSPVFTGSSLNGHARKLTVLLTATYLHQTSFELPHTHTQIYIPVSVHPRIRGRELDIGSRKRTLEMKFHPPMNSVLQNGFIIVSFVAGKALVSRHLTHTSLVNAYGNSFRKWPIPVIDTFNFWRPESARLRELPLYYLYGLATVVLVGNNPQ